MLPAGTQGRGSCMPRSGILRQQNNNDAAPQNRHDRNCSGGHAVIADRVIFVCIIILTAVYFYATAQIPSLEIGDPLGPKAFPRLLGIGMLFTAGLLFVEMWRAGKNGTQESAPR